MNTVLHDYLTQNNFAQNQADHCNNTRETEHDKLIVAIWKNDLIIAASDVKAKYVLRYLKGTNNEKLCNRKSIATLGIQAYSDTSL